MALKKGDQAPDFTLYSADKTEVSLSSYRGKNVLILFYPQAFTGVCTKELCDVRDNLSMYESLNTEILAISVDSVYTLVKYKADQSYNFPLLSDFNKEVSTAYGTIYDVWNLGMKGVSKRSAFVVDAKGIIQYAEVLESANDVPDFNAIKQTLDSLN
ncbi:MAG TPA: redoxin domain-containing protein [Saprospiraceae bacterium]|nr:redoxin domain-containing protein [Saprospiraceae bacterium]